MTGALRDPPLRWDTDEELEVRPRERLLAVHRAALAAAPDRPEPRRRLARLLLHTERLDELHEVARPALDDPEPDPEVLHCLGICALAQGDQELALRALQRAVELGWMRSHGALASLLHTLGREEEALASGLCRLEQDPTDYNASSVVAHILLGRGEHGRLWSLCQEVRSRGAWGAYLPSAMALSAQTEEQHREAERLVGRGTWFTHGSGVVSPELNRRVREELLGEMDARPLPRLKASIGSGRRINQLHLVARSNPVIAELLDALRGFVDDYVRQRQDALADPTRNLALGGAVPEAVYFDSWSLAMHDDGHEDWHLHPAGWLSGVYYVDVPDTSASGAPHAGEIEFGPFPFATDVDPPSWPSWRVRPRTGDTVLFPSSYGHRTWPTGVSEPRIVVAFDVQPVIAAP